MLKMPKKKNKLTFELLIIFFLIAFGTIGIFFYDHDKSPSESAKIATDSSEVANDTDQTNVKEPTVLGAMSTDTINDLSNLKIPVLMYHHIRLFDDPNDKIGTNLSVPPDNFAKQLDYIKSKGYAPVTFNDLLSGDLPDKPAILTFDDGYDNFYANAYPELKKRSMKAVVFIMTGPIGKTGSMTESELKEISSNGIEIGSHTVTHPDLTIISHDKAVKEITDSKNTLENIIGKKVISFCYPSGKYNADVENIVKSVDYNFAVTTNGGVTTFENLFALNRFRVNNDTSVNSFLK